MRRKEKNNPVSVRLDDSMQTFLKEYGPGITQGIERLITEKKDLIEGRTKIKPIEERFYDGLILPADANLKETYKAFVESFIMFKGVRAVLDFYSPKLSGLTGFDDKTIRKHFRKLEAMGFVKADGLLFRPTIRLNDGIKDEVFKLMYNEFMDFVGKKGKYRDIGYDIWE